MSEAGTSKQVESLHEQDELVRRRLQRTCSVTLPCLKIIDLDVPEDLRDVTKLAACPIGSLAVPSIRHGPDHARLHRSSSLHRSSFH